MKEQNLDKKALRKAASILMNQHKCDKCMFIKICQESRNIEELCTRAWENMLRESVKIGDL